VRDDDPSTAGLGPYSSPTAVFDAFRKARSKQNWGRCFSFLSPAAQNHVVFETFFALATKDSSESRAILREYGLDEGSLTAIFETRLNKSNGDAGGAPKSHNETAEVVCRTVRNKREFYIRGRNLLDSKDQVPSLGDLQDLVVDGDVARGMAKTTTMHVESSGGPSRSVETEVYQTFSFRKLDESWLLDVRLE
jgi:hypothetical protein